MRGTLRPSSALRPAVVLLALIAALAPASAEGPAEGPAGAPVPVSPAGLEEGACPTFSWSGVAGLAGYEVAVHRVPERSDGEPVLQARLPGGATVWTPSGTACLASGERYVWSVRVLADDGTPATEEAWSEPQTFRVAPVPSSSEVEVALAALRRSLAREDGGATPAGAAPSSEREGGDPSGALRRPARPGDGGFADDGEGPTTAAAPALGSPSLTLDGNVAFGAGSDVFKDGAVFLWDDTSGNSALGRHALASATGESDGNTALGWEALRYTTEGADATRGSSGTGAGYRALKANTTGSSNTAVGSVALYQSTEGDENTAVGARALFSNTTGHSNTAHGGYALESNSTGARNTSSGDLTLVDNTSGSRNTAAGPFALSATTGSGNTAYGVSALQSNTSGERNVAVGYSAGVNATTGNDNVFLSSLGEAGDAGKIRIGDAALGIQDGAFIAGIRGTTTGETDALDVVVDSTGQLGTVSSSRAVKEDLRPVEGLSRRLLDLRPVAFRYREHVERDPGARVHYGLLAEEVAEVFPELVVEDAQGQPWSVKYRLLEPLLLNELQRLHGRLDERRPELEVLDERLGALEGAGPPGAPE